METLQHILNLPDSIILVDSNIQGGDRVGEKMYDAKSFSELDLTVLKDAERDLESAKQVLLRENTHTIPEVSREIERFIAILSSTITYLPQPSKASTKKRVKRRRRRIHETRGETTLKAFQTQAYDFITLLRRKELIIDDPRYEALIDLIKLIEVPLRLKKDTASLHRQYKERDTHSSDTDERLTATLFWLSLVSAQKPVLITRDTDFVSLSSVVPRIIGADNFLPLNAEFREALSKNPYRLYITNQEYRTQYDLAVDSSTLHYDTKFNLINLSAAKNKEKQEEIKSLWLKFNEAHD